MTVKSAVLALLAPSAARTVNVAVPAVRPALLATVTTPVLLSMAKALPGLLVRL